MADKKPSKSELAVRKATLEAVLKLPLKPLPGQKKVDALAVLYELRYGSAK